MKFIKMKDLLDLRYFYEEQHAVPEGAQDDTQAGDESTRHGSLLDQQT